MFSGIVETTGIIIEVLSNLSNIELWIEAPFVAELALDQSIAHQGICLTVDKIEGKLYRVTAIKETIEKTTISQWKIGQRINLERCIRWSDRLDGHIVQGHIETIATCIKRETQQGSINFTFEYSIDFQKYIIEKGSITIDGISLTVHSLSHNTYIVSLIPYTLDYTTASQWQENTKVNIEFDIIGKYVLRSMELKLQ